MSDFDRNVAARGFGAAPAVAVDAGLRAYMIRVYNYMAAGVALTGVVAWLTFNARWSPTRPDASPRLTPFGQTHLQRAIALIVLFLAHAGAGVLHELPHPQPAASDRADRCSWLYAALLGLIAVVNLPGLHRGVDHPGVLHLGGVVRRAEPVRLHHAA